MIRRAIVNLEQPQSCVMQFANKKVDSWSILPCYGEDATVKLIAREFGVPEPRPFFSVVYRVVGQIHRKKLFLIKTGTSKWRTDVEL